LSATLLALSMALAEEEVEEPDALPYLTMRGAASDTENCTTLTTFQIVDATPNRGQLAFTMYDRATGHAVSTPMLCGNGFTWTCINYSTIGTCGRIGAFTHHACGVASPTTGEITATFPDAFASAILYVAEMNCHNSIERVNAATLALGCTMTATFTSFTCTTNRPVVLFYRGGFTTGSVGEDWVTIASQGITPTSLQGILSGRDGSDDLTAVAQYSSCTTNSALLVELGTVNLDVAVQAGIGGDGGGGYIIFFRRRRR
jgi:hypothetical protein